MGCHRCIVPPVRIEDIVGSSLLHRRLRSRVSTVTSVHVQPRSITVSSATRLAPILLSTDAS